jgi:hypothetical protein
MSAEPRVKEMLLYEPHNMLISGVTDSGKTHFVLDLIDKFYFKKFKFNVIFCPTYFNNETYRRKWIYNDSNVIIINPSAVKEDIDGVLKFASATYENEKTLFIIDDCANLHNTNRKRTALCDLGFSGITVRVLIQKYNSIVKDFRENIKILVLFYSSDEKAMKLAFEENAIIPNYSKRKKAGSY